MDYKEVYIKRGIWEVWHNLDWNDYTEEYYREKVQEFVKMDEPKNVLLYGNNGTGKTMLMNLAFKDMIVYLNRDVQIIDFRNLVKEYVASWRNNGRLKDLLDCDYLGIDDLGKEFNSGEVSKELAVTTLDYVLRYRVQRQKPVWMTFNLMLSDIETTYNKHIASLIKRSSVALPFDGNDYGDNLFKKIVR